MLALKFPLLWGFGTRVLAVSVLFLLVYTSVLSVSFALPYRIIILIYILISILIYIIISLLIY